jgi:predicted metal-binding membrane protein
LVAGPETTGLGHQRNLAGDAILAPRINDRRPFAVLLISLIGLSWLTLLLWGVFPYSRYLSHEAIEELGGRLSLDCAGLALVFVAAWILMTVATMLPTALPLVLLFQRFVLARGNSYRLTATVIACYLLVWALFGAATYLSDLGVHTAVDHSHLLKERPWS